MSLLSLLIILIILIVLIYLIGKWANGPLNPIKKDLTGKLIIITGSSDGIGLETAKDLLKSNAKVIFACRNKAKTEGIINTFPENLKKNSIFVQLNLESFKSISNFVKEIKSKFQKIDVLINNAGISSWNKAYKTEDEYVNVYQTNYLGSVLLTLLLLDHFNEKESKIINLSSIEHKRATLTYGDSKYLNNYDLMSKHFSEMIYKQNFYSNTKLLMIYFTQYLARLSEEKYPYLKIVCLHPGVIFTKIFIPDNALINILFTIFVKSIFYLFTKDVVHGAQTTLFLAYSDNKDLVNGGYYADLKHEKYIPIARDEKLRNEMINETLNGLKMKYKELEYLPLSK
jgi:retinol dehydrogenase-13